MTALLSRPELENYPGIRHYSWRNLTLQTGDPFMQFRLIYDGLLLSSGNNCRRREEKHDMRRQFNEQLLKFWNSQTVLRHRKTRIAPEDTYLQARRDDPDDEFFAEANTSEAETLANRYTRDGFRFLPLVNSVWNLTCDLDLTFLQNQVPGDPIFQSGDIDNRIKTLLDALKTPSDPSEVRGFTPEGNEDPFHCLMEDDKLISGFSVNMDRLLTVGDDNPNRVHLIIQVTLRAFDVTYLNMDLIGR